MNKKGTKALASATLMSLVLTTALATGNVKAAAGSVTQTGGKDRYETAAKVATANFADGSENVILVNGLSYADSVSASALAKTLKAPILLTTADELNANAKDALNTLKPKNVYIVGGEAAVSKSVADSLSDYTVTRLSGANRYATNLAVANELVKNHGVSKDNLLVVTGQAYSDALSAAPVAAAKDEILLLSTNDKTVMDGTYDFAKDSNVTVIGTTNSVNDATYTSLKADKRVDGGANRFATNLQILKAFDTDLKADKLYVATAKPNASGSNDTAFADALVASAVAGNNSAPLVLLGADDSDAAAISYIGTKATKTTDLQAIGGTGVITPATVQKINDVVNNPTPDTDPEVSSITANGLNQIKVVFNQEVDSDTAEDLSNYEVDGTGLDTIATVNKDGKDITKTNAKLQDDNKTLLITLGDKEDQNKSVDVKVKKGVLTEDKSQTVPEYTQNVTFSDTTAPTVDSVEVRGNKKLVVKFSEPVKVGATSNAKDVYSKFKVNGNNIASLGLDTDNTEAKDAVYDGTNYLTNEIDFYFTTALNSGNNTLKVSDGTDNILEDVAGFPISETSKDFDVDTLTSAPKITSITAEDNGKVYVNFDRPMDKDTTTKESNYSNFKINGIPLEKITDSNPNGNVSNIELKKDDTQIKISGLKGTAKLNKNSNTIYISNNVKDAYGNYVADDTNESFNLTEDTTKPTVNSVYALNDNTIRVKFSKDIDASYATNPSNYKLRDNSGNDITGQIGTIAIPGGSTTDTSTDIVDIPLTGSNKLSDSKYSITIKNIQDLASTPNVMNDYTTTFSGSDDVNSGVKVYNVDSKKITLVFTKEMDSSTLDDISNYKYVNAAGDSAKLFPSKTHISVSNDNKSVTIDLTDTSLATNASNDSNKVVSVYATGVKDSNGNLLDVGNNGGALQAASTTVKAKDNSLKIYYDGKDLKADINFENPIDADTLSADSKNNFKLGNNDNSVAVSSNAVSVNKNGGLTLTFNRDSKDGSDLSTNINKIKALGNKVILNSVDPSVKDVTGAALTNTTVTNKAITPYFYDAAPKTVVTKDSNGNVSGWTATKTITGDKVTDASVTVQFDTPIANVRATDFKFNIGGTTVEADNAVVNNNNNTVTFTFDQDNDNVQSFKNANTIVVTPKDTLGNTLKDISTVKDGNGDYAYYVPSSDDLSGVTVKITLKDTTVPSEPTVNSVKATDTVVTGTAEANSTVTVKVGDTKLGEVQADADGDYSVAISAQSKGTNLSVTATDAAGNTSSAATVVVTE